MSTDDRGRESKFQLWGWILFMVCAFFFIAQSIVNGSALGLVASIIFLVACVVFIIPLVQGGGEAD